MKPPEPKDFLAPFWIPQASLKFEGRGQVDGILFRVLQAQLYFGTILHKSALRPYLAVQTVGLRHMIHYANPEERRY